MNYTAMLAPTDTFVKPKQGNAECTPVESMAACLMAENFDNTWSWALEELRQAPQGYSNYIRMAQRAIEHINYLPTKFDLKPTNFFWLGKDGE